MSEIHFHAYSLRTHAGRAMAVILLGIAQTPQQTISEILRDAERH